jgi:hypothetical protein
VEKTASKVQLFQREGANMLYWPASQVAYKKNSWISVCSQWWTPPHPLWPQPELHHLDTVCWISRFSCQCHTPLGHTHSNLSSKLGSAHSNLSNYLGHVQSNNLEFALSNLSSNLGCALSNLSNILGRALSNLSSNLGRLHLPTNQAICPELKVNIRIANSQQ